MRRVLPLVVVLALPAAALAQAAPQSPPTDKPAPIGDNGPAAAGRTKKCMPNRDIQITNLSPANGYWVKTINGWWRNLATGCPWYDSNRILRTLSNNDMQCSGDILEVVDRASRRIVFGTCGIGDWEKMKAAPSTAPAGVK